MINWINLILKLEEKNPVYGWVLSDLNELEQIALDIKEPLIVGNQVPNKTYHQIVGIAILSISKLEYLLKKLGLIKDKEQYKIKQIIENSKSLNQLEKDHLKFLFYVRHTLVHNGEHADQKFLDDINDNIKKLNLNSYTLDSLTTIDPSLLALYIKLIKKLILLDIGGSHLSEEDKKSIEESLMNKNQVVLEGKKINLEWKEGEKIEVNAYPIFNKISLTKKADDILSDDELYSVLFHERAHFQIFNNFLLPFYPWIIFFVTLGCIILGFKNKYLNFIVNNALFFILLVLFSFFLCLWFKELFADKYSTIKTKKGVFKRALEKIYKHNGKLTSKFEKILRMYIFYPPPCLRLCLIDKFEEKKLIEESLK